VKRYLEPVFGGVPLLEVAGAATRAGWHRAGVVLDGPCPSRFGMSGAVRNGTQRKIRSHWGTACSPLQQGPLQFVLPPAPLTVLSLRF